jgi:hypothetical protein
MCEHCDPDPEETKEFRLSLIEDVRQKEDGAYRIAFEHSSVSERTTELLMSVIKIILKEEFDSKAVQVEKIGESERIWFYTQSKAKVLRAIEAVNEMQCIRERRIAQLN